MRRGSQPLPDLDEDEEFRRRLSPLLETALPENRRPIEPDIRAYGHPDKKAAPADGGREPKPEDTTAKGRVNAAEKQAHVEEKRGAKRRFEYLIPERVGKALAEDAAAQGKSATTRLLEVLRDAGYPVIREDLMDLRKMPKR